MADYKNERDGGEECSFILLHSLTLQNLSQIVLSDLLLETKECPLKFCIVELCASFCVVESCGVRH